MKYKLSTTAIAALMLLSPLAIAQDGHSGSGAKSGSGVKAMADQTPTLESMLEKRAAMSAQKMPPEMMAKAKKGIEAARASGVEKSAKQVGDMAPDATLTNFNGESVQLSSLWQEGPVVLMWYRGGWCPYCNIQLQAMNAALKDIQGAGARLVVLSPEIAEKAKETAAKTGAAFVAFQDTDSAVARDYGLVYQLDEAIVPMYRDRLKLNEFNGNDKMELPLAATYVIDKDGVIQYAFLDADYKKRAEPSDVVAAVKALAEKSSSSNHGSGMKSGNGSGGK